MRQPIATVPQNGLEDDPGGEQIHVRGGVSPRPVEGEALAVAEGLAKARFFVLGCKDLIVVVDHKPLVKILGDRSLVDLPNARLRNLNEKTLHFKFQVCYIPEVKNRVPDETSRHPSGPPLACLSAMTSP